MHAFLIMVHDNSYVFFQNLKLIDSPKTDIYIHVDKKFKDFNYEVARDTVEYSNVCFINNRINVNWGGYSQVLAELRLLQTACAEKKYDYFHLISGSDMLIKPVSTIMKICDGSQKALFLDCRKITKTKDTKLYQRIAVPHILVSSFGSKNKLKSIFARLIDVFQANFRFYILGQDKVKNKNIFFGSNWFSLPDDAVKYIVNNKKEIDNIFSKGRNVDELFVQTILGNEKLFKNRMVNPKRFIDWSAELAHPKVLTVDDYQRIITSDAFFARKFDVSVDKDIISKIFLDVVNRNKDYKI